MHQRSLTPSSWPGEWCDARRARSWIGSVAGPAAGPVEVFRVKSWGVTAVFLAGATPVVFHACRLPLFGRSPRIYEMLGRACPDRVPALIAAAEHVGQAWTPFPHLDRRLIGTAPGLDEVIALARAAAQVQAGVAALPDAERRDLPRSSVERLPEWLDELIADVQRRRPRARHVFDRLRLLQAPVRRWTDQLLAGGRPESIDHTDLHTRNAVIDDQGGVRILDWEEAVIGLPFFSLDRLLDDARWLGRPGGPRLSVRAPETPAVVAVREAYLSALPWGSLPERRRALELALALAPIKEAREFWRALGRPGGNPYLTGFFALRALCRGVTAA